VLWIACIVGALAVTLAVASVAMAWHGVVRLGRNGCSARVSVVPGGQVPPEMRPDVDSLLWAGLVVAAVTRTDFDGQRPECTVHLVDPTGPVVVRVMGIEGLAANGTSVSVVSWYPGGVLVTSRLAQVALRPDEVLQTFPGAGPIDLVLRHRDAVAALWSHGAPPLSVPDDLAAALEADWRADGAVLLALPPSGQIRMARHIHVRATVATPLVARPDLPELARALASVPSPA
jgi:hypothetical protein